MPIKKSLLIIGHPRSGKTTLGNMIADNRNFSMLTVDALIQTFKAILPELGMHHEPEQSEAAFAPFLFKYMDWIMHKSVYRQYVIETCHVGPKSAEEMMNKDKYRLVVLGSPSLTPEQYAEAIRKNDKSFDWTAKKDDAELLQIAESFINKANQLKSECDDLGITFIDTSFDREEKFTKFVESLDGFLA